VCLPSRVHGRHLLCILTHACRAVLLPCGLASQRWSGHRAGKAASGIGVEEEDGSKAEAEEGAEDGGKEEGAEADDDGMSLSYAKQCLENTLCLLSHDSPLSESGIGAGWGGLAGAAAGGLASAGSGSAGAGGNASVSREDEAVGGNDAGDDVSAMAGSVAAREEKVKAERWLLSQVRRCCSGRESEEGWGPECRVDGCACDCVFVRTSVRIP
jgi:hypothetical protein